ncbi:MAG: N-acetylglucosamine-6-phosphate deacetylase [Chloroflexi bacterium]|nr:N-acetylglucosamine-6-phosphate deacetylase [Chloroflexota bacterium]
MLYIRCSNLIGSKRQARDAIVLLDGSQIRAVESAADLPIPANAQMLDARGLSLAPGFIDWQLNGGFGLDFTENPGSIWDVAARLPEHGVTAFLPTIITAPLDVYAAAQDVMHAGAPSGFRGAQPLGLHFEGPYLNPGKKGAHNPAYLRNPATAETSSWSRKNGVWLVTLAPELSGAQALIKALLKKGVVVSAGHSLATYDQGLDAFAAGVSCVTHLFNAMPPLDHRVPGLIAASLQTHKVTVGLIPDGIHVHPAMVALAWKQKGPRGMAIVTDAMGALGMPPGLYGLGDYHVRVDEVSARLENGTLAGSILRLDQAVRNLMAFTGCSLAQAVGAASINVAKLIGAGRKGRLQPGADADLVLLDDQAGVVATIVRGEVVFSKL